MCIQWLHHYKLIVKSIRLIWFPLIPTSYGVNGKSYDSSYIEQNPTQYLVA
jgi:hypothetical protein